MSTEIAQLCKGTYNNQLQQSIYHYTIVFGSTDKYKWLKDSFPVNILGNCLSQQMLFVIWVYCLTLNLVSLIM